VPARQSKVPSDGVMADVFLGVTVASLYTLVGWGSSSHSCEGKPDGPSWAGGVCSASGLVIGSGAFKCSLELAGRCGRPT
jgi:hypothetical protein